MRDRKRKGRKEVGGGRHVERGCCRDWEERLESVSNGRVGKKREERTESC